MRESGNVVHIGWVDENSGLPCRRTSTALMLWGYTNDHFTERYYFAVPEVRNKEQALEVGYQMLVAKVGLSMREGT